MVHLNITVSDNYVHIYSFPSYFCLSHIRFSEQDLPCIRKYFEAREELFSAQTDSCVQFSC